MYKKKTHVQEDPLYKRRLRVPLVPLRARNEKKSAPCFSDTVETGSGGDEWQIKDEVVAYG